MLRSALLCATIFLALCSFPVHGEISETTLTAIRNLPVDPALQDEFIENFEDIRNWILNDLMAPPRAGRPQASLQCLGCRVLMQVVITLMRLSDDIGAIVSLLKLVACPALHPSLHQDVCRGALDMYADDVHYIMKNHVDLKPLDVCGIILGKTGNCPPIASNFTDWVININGDKPPPIYDSLPYLPETVEPVKILHVTDIHLDLDYEVGKNTDCGKPMCCQNIEADGATPETRAGLHGDYQCDMPRSSMDELFETSAKDTYEFVMMTGDIPPHNIWNTTLEGNLAHYAAANNKLVQLFSVEKGIPVYPVMGNHEPHPCNLFPPKSVWDVPEFDNKFDKAWMYDAIAEQYQDQIQDPVALAQFRETGYYTIKHKNLRLIVLNTNLCYTLNFWLYFDLIDPQGQLQWLAYTLEQAEQANEPVWILGHVPPGSDSCWSTWSAKFEEIVLRYESTIRAQFYGHTHNDETAVFFDSKEDPPRPANSLFIGVSTTAYTDINPGYKVFYADGARDGNSTWEIMDHETFIYNLTEANAAPAGSPLPWKSLYKAKEAYGLMSFRPRDLYDLAHRMMFNDELFQKYWVAYQKDSHTKSRCRTEECMLNYVCEMVTANSGDYSHCERMREIRQGTTIVTTPSTASPSTTGPSVSTFPTPQTESSTSGQTITDGSTVIPTTPNGASPILMSTFLFTMALGIMAIGIP